MLKQFKTVKEITKILIKGFDTHNTLIYAGTIAFYMIFSLPGLLITSIAVGGIFIGQEEAQAELTNQLGGYLSESAVASVSETVQSIDFSEDNIVRTIIGVCVLLFSATTVFVTLQQALNRAWDVVAVPKKSFLKLIFDRLLSFGMIVCLGFIMLVSLLIDLILNFFFTQLVDLFGEGAAFLLEIAGYITSFASVLLIFMLIFKFLPDVIIKWKDVFIASLVTTSLFVFGKYLVGLYIDSSNFSETYQAAGSVIVILVWVFCSTIMVLFGAEIVRAIKHYKGEPIHPSKTATKVKQVQMDYNEYVRRVNESDPE